METDLRVTRGAQSFAYSIESPARTIGFVKAQKSMAETLRYAGCFALSVKMYDLLKRIRDAHHGAAAVSSRDDHETDLTQPFIQEINEIIEVLQP